MNSRPTRKPAFLERLLTVRLLWAVVFATATLTSATLTAQLQPLPDNTPPTQPPQVEPPPERPVPPPPPVEPRTPSEPEVPPVPPGAGSGDDTGGQSGSQVPTVANDLFLEAGNDEAFVADASVADTIAQVETELRRVLKISAAEPGLRVRVQKGTFLGAAAGLWRYLSADNIQVWARWILPTNTSSGLKLFAQYHYTGPHSGDSADFLNLANYAISEESRLYVQDVNLRGLTASWTPGHPVNFWTLLTREDPGGSTFTVESLTAEFASLSNLSVNADTFGGQYFTVSADLTTSLEFPGVRTLLDIQRTLRRISRQGVREVAAVSGPVMPVEPANPPAPERPTVRPEPTGDTTPPVQSETPPVQPAPGAGGGLEGLSLQLSNPQLELGEEVASIPLFFTVLGAYTGTNDITVRARFVSGTATPGQDFDMSQPSRVLPASWIGFFDRLELPTILDEVNEGTETAVFELSIDGSTNAPVRVEVSLLDDLNPGEVGFVSPRYQVSEGSTFGYVQISLWRTRNYREAATVTYRLEGPAAALALLGGQTNRTATFEPGQTQTAVRIPLVNNTGQQGTLNVTLTLESIEGGLKLIPGFESTVLTLTDDETPSPSEPLTIFEYDNGGGQRGVMLKTRVARGYQVRLESSDTGVAGPWRTYWIFEGADTERYAFDSFDASVMRMYRILPPEPLDYTFPW
jgi:Calx-beta domain